MNIIKTPVACLRWIDVFNHFPSRHLNMAGISFPAVFFSPPPSDFSVSCCKYSLQVWRFHALVVVCVGGSLLSPSLQTHPPPPITAWEVFLWHVRGMTYHVIYVCFKSKRSWKDNSGLLKKTFLKTNRVSSSHFCKEGFYFSWWHHFIFVPPT